MSLKKRTIFITKNKNIDLVIIDKKMPKVEGLDVIDKIAAVQKAPGDRPIQDVKMQVKVLR